MQQWAVEHVSVLQVLEETNECNDGSVSKWSSGRFLKLWYRSLTWSACSRRNARSNGSTSKLLIAVATASSETDRRCPCAAEDRAVGGSAKDWISRQNPAANCRTDRSLSVPKVVQLVGERKWERIVQHRSSMCQCFRLENGQYLRLVDGSLRSTGCWQVSESEGYVSAVGRWQENRV